MIDEVYRTATTKMDSSKLTLRKELATIRTGRASVSMLDDVRIEYYGNTTPINQVANLTVPESNLIVIQPWDPSHLAPIEKAIHKANLGLTPSNDGKIVRVPIPQLTEDRRKEFAKRAREIGEEIRTAVRNVRREANDEVKKLEKQKAVSQDDEKVALKHIQELTDKAIQEIDQLVKAKAEEVLQL